MNDNCPQCNGDNISQLTITHALVCQNCELTMVLYPPLHQREGKSFDVTELLREQWRALPRSPRYETTIPSEPGLYLWK